MKSKASRFLCLLCIVSIFLSILGCGGAGKASAPEGPDWPRWRGPNGDGISTETNWNPQALAGGSKILWTADIGYGYSNVVIQNGRLYTMGMYKDKLAFSCLNAETGKTIWRRTFPEIAEPMATPAVDGDRVYGLSKDGTLFCLSSASGKQLWAKNLESDFQAEEPYYGWATSPVVEGELILLNVNDAGAALNKNTGELIWASPTAPSGVPASYGYYATPVLCDFEGTRCALFFGPSELSAVETATGKRLWSYTHDETSHPLADPVIFSHQLFISQPMSMLLQMAPGEPQVIWDNRDLLTGLSTAVYVDGYLYGTHQETFVPNRAWDIWLGLTVPFRCIEVKTGKLLWEQPMHTVSLIEANGKLILLESNGTLRIAEATPAGYVELSSADVFNGQDKPRQFPTPPVLCGGRIYCRNFAGELICIDVSK